jgi:hypothetical protein
LGLSLIGLSAGTGRSRCLLFGMSRPRLYSVGLCILFSRNVDARIDFVENSSPESVVYTRNGDIRQSEPDPFKRPFHHRCDVKFDRREYRVAPHITPAFRLRIGTPHQQLSGAGRDPLLRTLVACFFTNYATHPRVVLPQYDRTFPS